MLTGLVMLAAGLLKLGRLLRFVANSVVIGFLTGVSINVILSQVGDFTGYSSAYTNKVVKAVDTLLHLDQISFQTTAIGVLTVAVILLVDRTRLRNFSHADRHGDRLACSDRSCGLDADCVQQVSDVATIPTSLPLPQLPNFTLDAGAADGCHRPRDHRADPGRWGEQGLPQPGRQLPDTSRDFVGQGAANIGAGLLQGMPIGGSVSGTALNISSGAKSRWANIFSGLLVVLAVLLFSRAVSLVAMPAMAGLLIVAGAPVDQDASGSPTFGTPAGPRAS